MSSGFAFRRPTPKKTAAWHYHQRRQRRDLRMGYAGWPLRVEQIGDRDNWYHCFEQLKREGGPAAGVDGLHAADFSPSEAGAYMGVLSACLLNGTYKPQKVRCAPIPKPGTDEHRILKIGVLGDRVVGKAVHNAFGPFWETKFLDCSYGFRPARSTWRMPAELNVCLKKLNRWALVVADVRRFGRLPATHSYLGKAWGVLLFASAAAALLGWGLAGALLQATLALGGLAYLDGLLILLIAPTQPVDVPSAFHAWRGRRASAKK